MDISSEYDLAIIGGGINGAAIARDAALRKLRVILLEKEDFGSGASSKTSKLAHGGLRYLEHFEVGLVYESLHERALLLKNAPHLVEPLPFLMPIYQEDPHSFWQIKLGFFLYDLLASHDALPKHQVLSKEEVLAQFPGINPEGLKGGILYYDAQMKDNRLIIENILSASHNGAIALNYSEVLGLDLDQDTVHTIRVKCANTGSETLIKAKVIVNATGAWSNHLLEMDHVQEEIQVDPTKGVHLVLPQISKNIALILRAPQDQRVFFLLPWMGYSLLGTTDTKFNGNPNEVFVNQEDKSYLLDALHHYFKDTEINESSIIASYAGLRPLVSSRETVPSSKSRRERLYVSKSGMITVLGGKYTTFRRIAEKVVDEVIKRISPAKSWDDCQTKALPLWDISQAEQIESCNLPEEQIIHLQQNYGNTLPFLLKTIREDPKESTIICACHPHIMAEITLAIKIEQAKTLQDWFCRRTSIAFTKCRGLQCLEKTADRFSALLGWDLVTRKKQVEAYLKSQITG